MAAISVVIPAYNREATLGVSLDSLLAQTHPDWEAVVVDDGSADGTAQVAEQYAARDPRIRLHRQPNGGVSSARNAAIALARHEYLFFLDADDWVTPEAFSQLTAALERHPDAQLINGGCTRILADGTEIPEERVAEGDDLFAKFARTCAFSIHTALVETELVRKLGGYDESLVTCEDWDLWQRIVRTGARFASVPENVSFYNVRSGSASADGVRMLTDGLLVIARGHGEDPRLAGWPNVLRLGGSAETSARSARLYLAAYTAGLEVAKGQDGARLLDLIEDRHPGEAEGVGMAHTIFQAIAVARGTSVRRWPDYPPEVHRELHRFVEAVGRFARDHWLALTMDQTLEELILQNGVDHDELTVGRTRVTRPPLAGPLRDVALGGAERLMIVPRDLDDEEAPPIVVPAAGETAPRAIVADALAVTHAWEILRRHLDATVYPGLEVERGERIVARRGALTLADEPAPAEVETRHALHNAVGWLVLLQELWGRPEWSHERFYDPGVQPAPEDAGGPVVAGADAIGIVEIAQPLPAIDGVTGPLDVDVALAGLPFLRIRVSPTRGRVAAQALRGAISYAAGFELCHLVVREALLLWDGPADTPIRARLAAAAERRRAAAPTANGDARLLPGWRAAAAETGEGALLGRYRYGALSGAAGRYALLPGGALEHVRALARHTGQPLLEDDAGAAPAAILHAPFVIDRDREAVELGLRSDGRARWFERRQITGARSRTPTVAAARRDHVLQLLPEGPARQALEVGAADPALTAALGARAERLVVADISWLALQAAAARCAGAPNVAFQRTDLFEEPLPAGNDLVVLGDVLRWAESDADLRTAARAITAALTPDGALVLTASSARADAIWRALTDARMELAAVATAETFVVQRYERRARRPRPLRRARTIEGYKIEAEDDVAAAPPAALPVPDAPPSPAVPVLMYHRIADDGAPEARRWRTEPGAFEEQLAFLKDNGYRSIDIDEWAGAVALDRPLPGRGVILTFDDGFQDFGDHAVPLLQQYGFSAELFVVTGHVGGTDAWDTTWDRREPLLDWQALQNLPPDVVRIGSHTVGHAALTAVSAADAVRELVESRITLEDQLGRRVATIAYPYGLNDGATQRLAGALGYEVGYTTMPWWAFPTRNLLNLPRLEVRGGDPIATFARMVERPAA